MSVRFEDERYVRLYTRDTMTWKMLPWQSKCLLPLLLRKVDRAGVLDLVGYGVEGLAALLEIPPEMAEAGVKPLVDRGVVAFAGDVLVVRKFIEAQESRQSDAQRQRESRAKARNSAAEHPATPRDQTSHPVTNRDSESQSVTDCHTVSHDVTPAVPSRAVPVKNMSTRVDVDRAPDPVVLLDLWRSLCSRLRQPRGELRGKRREAAKAALKRRDVGGPDGWREVFSRVAQAPFCNGKGSDGWLADFDWAIRAEGKKLESAQLVLEGKYDRAGATAAKAPELVADTPAVVVDRWGKRVESPAEAAAL